MGTCFFGNNVLSTGLGKHSILTALIPSVTMAKRRVNDMMIACVMRTIRSFMVAEKTVGWGGREGEEEEGGLSLFRRESCRRASLSKEE